MCIRDSVRCERLTAICTLEWCGQRTYNSTRGTYTRSRRVCDIAERGGYVSHRPHSQEGLHGQHTHIIIPEPYLYVVIAVSYTHLRAHETPEHLVCRLLLEKKKKKQTQIQL
eukprot:TRINITY_DN19245_c0_g1_i3.p1 TRINITY_DN19245_c0_g1~~TRINITY_DN19245_c0_g1_i3.p1  ORF type:complete len:112 (+),score=25.86 TRINITY_DN19245_c0_g1_i3:171-506(+)